jgi:hypothetical protein
MCLENVATVVKIVSDGIAATAAIVALYVYSRNSKRERAQWVENLYLRFFKEEQLKTVRNGIDSDADEDLAKVNHWVNEESSDFTDYLNFFELVAYLRESEQIGKKDVSALFEYYLHGLKRNKKVLAYIENDKKGFKHLKKLLIEGIE